MRSEEDQTESQSEEDLDSHVQKKNDVLKESQNEIVNLKDDFKDTHADIIWIFHSMSEIEEDKIESEMRELFNLTDDSELRWISAIRVW